MRDGRVSLRSPENTLSRQFARESERESERERERARESERERARCILSSSACETKTEYSPGQNRSTLSSARPSDNLNSHLPDGPLEALPFLAADGTSIFSPSRPSVVSEDGASPFIEGLCFPLAASGAASLPSAAFLLFFPFFPP